jgi:hypothetical protein
MDLSREQRLICQRYGTHCDPPSADLKAGVARGTVGMIPVNGLRHRVEHGTSGWYIWGGLELSQADDFFDPLCHAHLKDYFALALPFLALPPGWRFLTDGAYVDVWYDATLLDP